MRELPARFRRCLLEKTSVSNPPSAAATRRLSWRFPVGSVKARFGIGQPDAVNLSIKPSLHSTSPFWYSANLMLDEPPLIVRMQP